MHDGLAGGAGVLDTELYPGDWEAAGVAPGAMLSTIPLFLPGMGGLGQGERYVATSDQPSGRAFLTVPVLGLVLLAYLFLWDRKEA